MLKTLKTTSKPRFDKKYFYPKTPNKLIILMKTSGGFCP
jgi:hypothetical protein